MFVFVVGPSGVGKDTLIDYARVKLSDDPDFRFVRRVVTRPISRGEDHEPVDAEEFERRAGSGDFALYWRAHGLSYGLPAIVHDWIAGGRVVIANGSRSVLPLALSLFPTLNVIKITASPAALAARLVARGRESEELIMERLARSHSTEQVNAPTREIDNSGSPDESGEALVGILLSVKNTIELG